MVALEWPPVQPQRDQYVVREGVLEELLDTWERRELALRDWSRRDSDVAERLHRIDNHRMEYLRALFGQFCVDEDDVEARCMLAFSLFIGSYFIAAEHGRRSRSEVLQLAADRLLDESWG